MAVSRSSPEGIVAMSAVESRASRAVVASSQVADLREDLKNTYIKSKTQQTKKNTDLSSFMKKYDEEEEKYYKVSLKKLSPQRYSPSEIFSVCQLLRFARLGIRHLASSVVASSAQAAGNHRLKSTEGLEQIYPLMQQ